MSAVLYLPSRVGTLQLVSKGCPDRGRVVFWSCSVLEVDVNIPTIVEGDDATKLVASALQGSQALGPSAHARHVRILWPLFTMDRSEESLVR